MPHSLRARLSGLRYKKIISDKDYDRLCKALDNENVIDKIRDEIIEYAIPDFEYHGCGGSQKIVELEDVLETIDKYRGESDCRECKVEHDCYECKKYDESEDK